MREMEENSVDAIVSDPPYGLSFMGANWDHGVPGTIYWKEALRVAKPGSHLLAFGGSRTHHRLMVAIEDAGWEIRDCLMWVFGSGMPKSLNVGKAIDKSAGAEREVVGIGTSGKPQSHNIFNMGLDIARDRYEYGGEYDISIPATDAAKQWDGWGTALKPAYEPIILARKPLDGTVAETVLKWGCGGINIDGCRIEYLTEQDRVSAIPQGRATSKIGAFAGKTENNAPRTEFLLTPSHGRWPANLLLDEESAILLDQQTGTLKSGSWPTKRKSSKFKSCYGEFKGDETCTPLRGANSGGASRFFYCAKASKKERSGSLHPTIKPLDLMQYLCRLITPPNGLILDPFIGSGTTAVAAIHEGFHFIGFEINETYCEDARRRIANALEEVTVEQTTLQPSTTLADFIGENSS